MPTFWSFLARRPVAAYFGLTFAISSVLTALLSGRTGVHALLVRMRRVASRISQVSGLGMRVTHRSEECRATAPRQFALDCFGDKAAAVPFETVVPRHQFGSPR